MILVKSKKCSKEKLLREFPDAVICDVTSHASDELVRLSPFYPHGGIPVPYSPGWTAMSVESVWQGLKVFASAGVDTSVFRNETMKNLKRTERRFGRTLGHRKGVNGEEMLGYVEARKLLYLPVYLWVLEHKATVALERLRELARTHTLILLDYNTNPNVEDASSPLSHASLIKAYLEDAYPACDRIGPPAPVPSGDESWTASPEEDLREGRRVRHPVFGEGTVESVDGAKIIVAFDSAGTRTLLISLAKLQVL